MSSFSPAFSIRLKSFILEHERLSKRDAERQILIDIDEKYILPFADLLKKVEVISQNSLLVIDTNFYDDLDIPARESDNVKKFISKFLLINSYLNKQFENFKCGRYYFYASDVPKKTEIELILRFFRWLGLLDFNGINVYTWSDNVKLAYAVDLSGEDRPNSNLSKTWDERSNIGLTVEVKPKAEVISDISAEDSSTENEPQSDGKENKDQVKRIGLVLGIIVSIIIITAGVGYLSFRFSPSIFEANFCNQVKNKTRIYRFYKSSNGWLGVDPDAQCESYLSPDRKFEEDPEKLPSLEITKPGIMQNQMIENSVSSGGGNININNINNFY